MKGTTAILIVLPFVIAFGLSASFAISGAAGYEGWFGIPAQTEPEPEKAPLDTLEKELSLGDDQRESFHCFREYCHGELGACRRRIAKARAGLGSAILSDPSDPERIERAREELLRVFDECSKIMVERILSLKDGLGPEQRKKLADAFFPGAVPECGGCGGGRHGGKCGDR